MANKQDNSDTTSEVPFDRFETQIELEKRLINEKLSGQREVAGETRMEFLMPTEKPTVARWHFRFGQIVEQIEAMERSIKALESINLHEDNPKEDEETMWDAMNEKWQLEVTKNKLELLKRAEREYEPMKKLFTFNGTKLAEKSTNFVGNLKVFLASYKKNHLDDGDGESVMVQFWLDSHATPVMKLKRKEPCDLSKRGITFEAHSSHTLEVQVFTKRGKLLGFVRIKLEWIQEQIRKTDFDRTFSGPVELIPQGEIYLDVTMNPALMNQIDTGGGIERKGALRRRDRLGHVFFDGPGLMKCSHCSELIYMSSKSCASTLITGSCLRTNF